MTPHHILAKLPLPLVVVAFVSVFRRMRSAARASYEADRATSLALGLRRIRNDDVRLISHNIGSLDPTPALRKRARFVISTIA